MIQMNEKVQFMVVEGPDCAGKSTLVENLKNALKWDSKALTHQEGDQFQRYLREYAQADGVIFDRGHVSEMVYSMIWRGGNPFSGAEKDLLDEICLRKGLLIYVSPSMITLYARYHAKKVLNKIDELPWKESIDLFHIEMNNLECISYDAENWSALEQCVKRVQERMK